MTLDYLVQKYYLQAELLRKKENEYNKSEGVKNFKLFLEIKNLEARQEELLDYLIETF